MCNYKKELIKYNECSKEENQGQDTKDLQKTITELQKQITKIKFITIVIT